MESNKVNFTFGVLVAVSQLGQPGAAPNHNLGDRPFNDEPSAATPYHKVNDRPFNDERVESMLTTVTIIKKQKNLNVLPLALNGKILTLRPSFEWQMTNVMILGPWCPTPGLSTTRTCYEGAHCMDKRRLQMQLTLFDSIAGLPVHA